MMLTIHRVIALALPPRPRVPHHRSENTSELQAKTPVVISVLVCANRVDANKLPHRLDRKKIPAQETIVILPTVALHSTTPQRQTEVALAAATLASAGRPSRMGSGRPAQE
jgi:hypothetical protein